MKHRLLRLIPIFLALCVGGVYSEEALIKIPDGGTSCLAPTNGGARPNLPAPNGKVELIKLSDGPVTEYWRFDITTAPANSWNVQLGANVTGRINKDDKCLLTFYCRAVAGRDKDGHIYGLAGVEDRAANYHKIGQTEFKAGVDWTPIVLPFIADAALTEGKGGVTIHLGKEVQCLDIGGLQLLNFGPDYDFAKLPRPILTYEGRAANAPWRAAALERIEKLRQGTLNLQILDAKGNAVPDAQVHATLKRHEFGFGTAVTAQWLCDTTADGEKYRSIVDDYFSKVVLENDLKLFAWDIYKKAKQEGSFRKAYLDQALAWLAEHHLPTRGHYLCWAPYEPWSEKLKSSPQAIRDRVLNHIDEILPAVGNRVCEWDAINHPAAWEKGICIDTVVGMDFYTEVFKRSRDKTKLPLWINEDQVFRPGRQQEEYYSIIKKLLADGVKIDGIGNQAHFHSSFLPSPEEMIANSDRFAALVPALQLTEFDLNTDGDDTLAADYTRDLLITCFSHPAYTGVVMWGFWEGSHWKPATALWRKDWSEKPNAKIWKEWVCGKWRTDVDLKTSSTGTAATKAFFGRYEITITHAGKTSRHEIEFPKSHTNPIKVHLQ